jgi:tetratricopeptide (TPR) repeat protein
MVTRVDSSMPAVVIQTRSYAMPIIAALALGAIGYLLIQVIKSLIGRVQPMATAAQLYDQGCTDLKSGMNAEAIQKFTLALQRMPDQQLRTKILGNRGVAFSKNEQLNEALEDFESALARKPTADVLIIIYSNRAIMNAKQNDHTSAVTDYDRALELPFSDNELHAVIFCRRALSHSVLTHYAQSLSDLNAAFALNPQDQYKRAEILAYRAGIKMKMNQPGTVLQDLTDALACDFKDPEFRRYIYRARGDFYAQTGAHAQAAGDYTQALNGRPDEGYMFAQIVYQRGCCFSALEQWDEALRDFKNADVLASEYSAYSADQLRANILFRRAIVYISQEQFQLAADDLTAAIKFYPSKDLDQMVYMRALVYIELNRYPEAIEDFTKALEMHPDDENYTAHLLHERGGAHRTNNHPDLARQDFEAALKCNITKEGLREALEAELNPKLEPQPAKNLTFLGWVGSKLPGGPKK